MPRRKADKFMYIGDCAAGCVRFVCDGQSIVFKIGEPVAVKSKSLAMKLSNNSHFERFTDVSNALTDGG